MLRYLLLSYVFILSFSYKSLAVCDSVVRSCFQHLSNTKTLQILSVGSMCEHLAYIEQSKIYSSNRYKLLQNIEYKSGKKILGELDLIVFDQSEQKVIKIFEVKCSKNIFDACTKSDIQLARFKSHIKRAISGRQKLYFRNDNSLLSIEHFMDEINFSKLTYLSPNAKSLGFDTLSLNLSEMQELTKKWNSSAILAISE
jgi:hypothetical protein